MQVFLIDMLTYFSTEVSVKTKKCGGGILSEASWLTCMKPLEEKELNWS